MFSMFTVFITNDKQVLFILVVYISNCNLNIGILTHIKCRFNLLKHRFLYLTRGKDQADRWFAKEDKL